jgi:hypothetical protein
MILNGTVKIRGRKLPIYWTGEFAQHLTENNRDEPLTHPFLHLEAQKLLQSCKQFKKSGKSFVGIMFKDGREIYIVFFIRSNFAIIKTCYIYARQ